MKGHSFINSADVLLKSVHFFVKGFPFVSKGLPFMIKEKRKQMTGTDGNPVYGCGGCLWCDNEAHEFQSFKLLKVI